MHIFPARKDLIDWVIENVDEELLAKIGKDPVRWADELNIIHHLISGDNMVCVIGPKPPIGQVGWTPLGERVFRYQGENLSERGLWLWPKSKDPELISEWQHFSLGTTARVYVQEEFSDIDPTVFLPENFICQSRLVREQRRQVRNWTVNHLGRKVSVYAKGSVFEGLSFFYQPPSFRLTNLSSAGRLSSEDEHARFEKLSRAGVAVPKTIAIYSSLVEDWLFVEEVSGERPDQCERSQHTAIIRQDAQMLSTLCRLGFRKVGFIDPDDKVFDGERLHLIDCDEVYDLYGHHRLDFRRVLLDPTTESELEAFRRFQRSEFLQTVKDVIWGYRETLLSSATKRQLYLREFAKHCRFRLTPTEISKLLTFGKNYVTSERTMAMLAED